MSKCPACRVKKDDCEKCFQYKKCRKKFDSCSNKLTISKLKCQNGKCDKTETCLCYESFVLMEIKIIEDIEITSDNNENSDYLEIIKIIESQ